MQLEAAYASMELGQFGIEDREGGRLGRGTAPL